MSSGVLFPGSFDPPTRGHVDLVERAALLFDRVVVAVGENRSKSSLFEPAERVEMLREETAHVPGVTVISFSGLAVECARERGCRAILRGVRDASDLGYEQQMAFTNGVLAPDVETVLLLPRHEWIFVSSRLIKEVYGAGGQIDAFLPPGVARRVRQVLGGPGEAGRP